MQIIGERLQTDPLTESREYASAEDINEFERRLAALEKLDEVTEKLFPDNTPTEYSDGPVSKRPFCNGFTGCGRLRGKRPVPSLMLDSLRLSNSPQSLHETSISHSPMRSKRPFCNGFFGCGNPGKRIVFRNAPKGYRGSRVPTGEKRFFCNPGAFGCSNRIKRSTLLQRMRNDIKDEE